MYEPLDGLFFITFSWLCNSVTVVNVQLKLIQIHIVYQRIMGEKLKYYEKRYIGRRISQQLHEK